jgi:hypothetical protein
MDHITLRVSNAPFPVALRRLMRSREDRGGRPFEIRQWAAYRIEEGVYVFVGDQSLPNERVTLTLKEADLTSALRRVCDKVEISYVFAFEDCVSQKITLSLEDVPLDQAVQRILQAAAPSRPLTFQLGRGILMVCPPPGPQVGATPLLPETLNRTITARFRDQNLWTALYGLLGVLKVNYSLVIDIAQSRNLAKFAAEGVTGRQLLERLLNVDPGNWRYFLQNDVLWVKGKNDSPG